MSKLVNDILHEDGRFLAGHLNEIVCDELDTARSTVLRWIGIAAYLEKCGGSVPADMKKAAMATAEYMMLAHNSVDQFGKVVDEYMDRSRDKYPDRSHE